MIKIRRALISVSDKKNILELAKVLKSLNIEIVSTGGTASLLKDNDIKEVEENEGMLHKGIAKRMFSKSFTIAEDVEIKGAELKDGLLSVSMERVIPDHKKARTIKIK